MKTEKQPSPLTLGEEIKHLFQDRADQYGKPEDHFEAIAKMWTTYLNKIPRDIDPRNQFHLQAKDVCMMMVILKVIREAHEHKRDNLLDIVGYSECANRAEGNE